MTPHPLLALVDQIIAAHNLATTAAALRADLFDLRAQTETFLNDYAELQRLLEEVRADNGKLKSKIWIQRLVFVLSKLLTFLDHYP